MLELDDLFLHADEDILGELAKPLSTDGSAAQPNKKWFSASGQLCQKVNAWLLADPSQRPSLSNDILDLLKSAEEALADQACLTGSEVTAADVSLAAAMAGFYKAVRLISGAVCPSCTDNPFTRRVHAGIHARGCSQVS